MALIERNDEPRDRVAPTNRALTLVTLTVVACLGLFSRLVGGEANAGLARQRRRAGSHTKALRGLLPICSTCKNIRDDNGCWTYLETFIEARSDVHFTHGLCPECQNNLFDRLSKRDEDKHGEPVLRQ